MARVTLLACRKEEVRDNVAETSSTTHLPWIHGDQEIQDNQSHLKGPVRRTRDYENRVCVRETHRWARVSINTRNTTRSRITLCINTSIVHTLHKLRHSQVVLCGQALQVVQGHRHLPAIR